ncbi:hypothetical protein [Oryza sativa Japonica Group]|uniref:Uncharacterized protein n=1 Tax=Oryza sativa subsp. japonica TaxID=39947 RepID=Q8RZ57_ORYSJ|nr:hypothetical protein [Oryza sativa Japonica Group]
MNGRLAPLAARRFRHRSCLSNPPPQLNLMPHYHSCNDVVGASGGVGMEWEGRGGEGGESGGLEEGVKVHVVE